MTNIQSTAGEAVPPARKFIPLRKIKELSGGAISYPKAVRMKATNPKNLKGEVLSFYLINGFYYVEEGETLRWLDGCKFKSSAEVPDAIHAGRREAFAKLRKVSKK